MSNPQITQPTQPSVQPPIHIRWHIQPPAGATFQASNGAHTYLMFLKGREVEMLNWLRNELDRLSHNVRVEQTAQLNLKTAVESINATDE